MAQYRTGTVTVTKDSHIITGVETAWRTYVTSGDLFILRDGRVSYTVSSVVSDTELHLTAPYGQDTVAGATYIIVSDFTPFFDIPLLYQGDLATATIVREALIKVEQVLVAHDTGQLVVKSRATTTPPADPNLQDTYVVPSEATGAWEGKSGNLASYSGGEWRFIPAQNGWRVWVEDESYADYIYVLATNTWVIGPTGASVSIVAGYEATAEAAAHTATTAIAGVDAKLSLAQQAVDDAEAQAEHASTSAGTAATTLQQVQALKGSIDATAEQVATDATAVTTAKVAAQTAETGAVAAQGLSETAQELAQDWAEKTTGTVDGSGHSAKYHAEAARISALDAEDAANTAVAAKLVATEKASDASATLASTNAVYNSALTKANEAASSASAASTSAQNAANSANTASVVATDSVNAKIDAVNAKTAAVAAQGASELAEAVAKNWAEKDENSQVQPGAYSAKHWAAKSQYWATQTASIVGGSSFGLIGDGSGVKISASSQSATLNFVQGANMTISFNSTTSTVSFAAVVPTVEDSVAMSIIFGS